MVIAPIELSEFESLTLSDSNSPTHYAVNMHSETPAHRRQRLSPEARQATILECAMHRFGATSYEETSIAHIAADANASVALVHKYFGTKAELYTHALTSTFQELEQRQQQADDAQQCARERVRLMLLSYIELISELPITWAKVFVHPKAEPLLATETRAQHRQREVEFIANLIGGIHGYRDTAALNGFSGFLSSATLAWLDDGRKKEHIYSLVDAALGALQGALGDWRN